MLKSVVVHPNSSQTKVVSQADGSLAVFVHEKALKNLANLAVVEALADFYLIKKSDVVLYKGSKSKVKIFQINEKN